MHIFIVVPAFRTGLYHFCRIYMIVPAELVMDYLIFLVISFTHNFVIADLLLVFIFMQTSSCLPLTHWLESFEFFAIGALWIVGSPRNSRLEDQPNELM